VVNFTMLEGEGSGEHMYYRILMHPLHCWAPDIKYHVAMYRTLAFTSCCGTVPNPDGSDKFSTIEEARKVIPADAKQLPFQPEHQFLELWESSETAGCTS
jgi:hypothetical protein